MTPDIYILKTYCELLSSGKGYANHKMYKQSEKKNCCKIAKQTDRIQCVLTCLLTSKQTVVNMSDCVGSFPVSNTLKALECQNSPSPAGRSLGSRDYKMPLLYANIHTCVCLSVCLLQFYLNPYISFMYEYIFTKFTQNIFRYDLHKIYITSKACLTVMF